MIYLQKKMYWLKWQTDANELLVGSIVLIYCNIILFNFHDSLNALFWGVFASVFDKYSTE